MIRSMTRRGTIAVAAAAALFPMLTGCSGLLSGSMVANADNAAAGSSAEAGSMLVRNAFVLGPEPGGEIPRGGAAAIYFTLYNSGETDELVGANAGSAAGEVTLSGESVQVIPEELVQVGAEGARMTLRELNKPLRGGESIALTLRFDRAGSVELHVPVLPRAGSYETLSPASSPTPSSTAGSPAAGGPSPDASGKATPPVRTQPTQETRQTQPTGSAFPQASGSNL